MNKHTLQLDPLVVDCKKNIFVIHYDRENNDRHNLSLSHLSQDDSVDSNQTGRWNKREHERFIVGILQFGNEWKKVEEVVKTRSSTQARSHAQKFFIKIKNIKMLSIGQFSTIKKFCEMIKSLDQNNKCQLLAELKNIPFDSEDFPSKDIKIKKKNVKYMKTLKKIKPKGKEKVMNNVVKNQTGSGDLIISNPNSNLNINNSSFGMNAGFIMGKAESNNAMNCSFNQMPKIINNEQMVYGNMNYSNENPIIYNNNINNLNINFFQQGFLNSQMNNSNVNINKSNQCPIINNSKSNSCNRNNYLNQSTGMPFNGQPSSLINESFTGLFSSINNNYLGSVMSYLNQQFSRYSFLFHQNLC